MDVLNASPERQPITRQMAAVIAGWEAMGDGRAVFLDCYRLMTLNTLTAVSSGEFYDPSWVFQLLHRFADYYFAALAAYEEGRPDTPAVWRAAFDQARSADPEALQILLLGVNAHINYDLVLALVDLLGPEWAALPEAQRRQRYADHCRVNEVIGRTIDAVQDQVIEPLVPQMAVVDTALGPLDEWLTSRLIARWREEVWHHTLAWLETADDEERARLRRDIEAATLQRADAILQEEGLLIFTRLF